MKAINQRAKKVMDLLTSGIDNEITDCKKIDNAKETSMAVDIECVGLSNLGPIYSVALRDPDMEFIKGGNGESYPISFRQDEPPIRNEVVLWKNGEITGWMGKEQARLVIFANTWMKNIKEQQGLVI